MTAPTAVLEGVHVRLEALTLDHVNKLCEVGLDPELWQWIPSPVRSREDMDAYVRAALDGRYLPYATIERASGTVVGSTRFGNLHLANRRIEIGWTWIARRWQPTAINTEAKFLMLEYAFGDLGCHRVEFRTDVLNRRSRQAILPLGALEEGVLRKHIVTASGRIRDTIIFSILDTEWPRVKKTLQKRMQDPTKQDR